MDSLIQWSQRCYFLQFDIDRVFQEIYCNLFTNPMKKNTYVLWNHHIKINEQV